MPKIFEYLGFIFFFYSNDHEPIHVHVKKGSVEVKVDFFFENNELINVSIKKYNGVKQNLTNAEREKIRKFVEKYHTDIVKEWNNFRAGKKVKCRKINKEVK